MYSPSGVVAQDVGMVDDTLEVAAAHLPVEVFG